MHTTVYITHVTPAILDKEIYSTINFGGSRTIPFEMPSAPIDLHGAGPGCWNAAGSRAAIAFIFLYSPFYNMAYNALTYTFLVELWPYHVRAKGIAIFQWWGRAAGFFNQFVNPIGIANAGM